MGRLRSDSTSVGILVGNLQEAIERGTLKPGDKLPTQQQMEAQYGVSRVVVREAIKMLEGMGLLYSRQGSGIYVAASQMPMNQPEKDLSGEYLLSEIYMTFESLFDYAVFEIVKEKDLLEIETLKRLNKQIRQDFATLSIHQKFSYETTFGSSILRFSNNTLASNLYLVFIKPLTNADYALVFDNRRFLKILEADSCIIRALLERDPYKARFWHQERVTIARETFREKNIWDKKYRL